MTLGKKQFITPYYLQKILNIKVRNDDGKGRENHWWKENAKGDISLMGQGGFENLVLIDEKRLMKIIREEH